MADNVTQIGEYRLTKKQRSYRAEGCQHMNMTMHADGVYVLCDDCKVQLTAYWVLERMLDMYGKEMDKLAAAREAQRKVATTTLHLKAAQRLESAWRSRTMAPACPHCGEVILPEDGFGGTLLNREMALRRREIRRAATALPVQPEQGGE